MKLLKRYWPLIVFAALSIKVYSDQPNLFSVRPHLKQNVNYGEWPTKKYQIVTDLQDAKDKSEILMYRGNEERQGWVHGDLAENYTEVWRFPHFNNQIHIAAKGSPVADETGIYVGSDMGWFYCFDFDGKIKWRFYNELSLKGVHGTPVIDGDFLFFGDYAGYLHAINKKTGELLWHRYLGVTLGASPLVVGNFIYANIELFPEDGYIAKFNKRTGEMVFKSQLLGQQSHSSPAYDQEGRQIVFGANNNILFSVDIETGTIGWSYKAKDKIKSTPLIFQKKVYYTSWGPELAANNLRTGMPEFSLPLKSSPNSSPALLKTSIITMDRHQLYQVSFDGKLLKTLDIHNTVHKGSPLVVRSGQQEQILFVCSDKNLCRADSSLSKVKIVFNGASLISAVPFVYKDFLILAENDGSLILLKKK